MFGGQKSVKEWLENSYWKVNDDIPEDVQSKLDNVVPFFYIPDYIEELSKSGHISRK